MHIVLVEPEIPGNTGNIARLCAATGASLHLVRPLGFSVDDRYLKRAGLDYWHLVDIHYYDSVEEVLAAYPDAPRFLLTTHAHRSYTRVEYTKDSLLIFGKESAGLPEAFRMAHEDVSVFPWCLKPAVSTLPILSQSCFTKHSAKYILI